MGINDLSVKDFYEEIGKGAPEVLRDIVALQRALIPVEEHTDLESTRKKLDLYRNLLSQPDPDDSVRHLIATTGGQYCVACRYAPSITAKSDAELLGISMPRFAIRVSLDRGNRCVVNLRRKALLKRSVDSDWADRRILPELDGKIGTRNPDLFSGDEQHLEQPVHRAGARNPDFVSSDEPDISLKQMVQKSSWIGDCFLSLPSWRGQYHINGQRWGAEIGEASYNQEHGEASYDQEQPLATVYMQPINLSGACAQACCHIANSMMRDFGAGGLYGVAEITYLMASDDFDEFRVSEASSFEVARFFCDKERVRLAAHVETVVSSGGQYVGMAFWRALRAYSLSGLPIIVPVHEQMIWDIWADGSENGDLRFVKKKRPDDGFSRHMICIVGCSRNSHSRELVAHDPAYGAYLRATSDRVLQANVSGMGRQGTYVPIVPSGVSLPYSIGVAIKEGIPSTCLGVNYLAGRLSNDSLFGDTSFKRFGHSRDLGEFVLLRTNEAAERIGAAEFTHRFGRHALRDQKKIGEAIYRLSAAVECGNLTPRNWIWAQFCEGDVRFWNAELGGISAEVLYSPGSAQLSTELQKFIS